MPDAANEKKHFEDFVESDRFVCEITNIGTANNSILGGVVNDQIEEGETSTSSSLTSSSLTSSLSSSLTSSLSSSIMSPGFFCVGHFNGSECDVHIEKISNSSDKKRPFLRTGEKGKCVITLRTKQKISIGMRIILRKNNNTVAFGSITKISNK